MKAVNIKWNIDDEEDVLQGRLPDEIDIPVGMIDEEEISDYLSDTTGFCHAGFELVGYPTIQAGSVQNAIDQIKDIYLDSDICMGELLNSLEVHGLSLEEVIRVYARLMAEFEGDIITRTNDEEDTCEVIN